MLKLEYFEDSNLQLFLAFQMCQLIREGMIWYTSCMRGLFDFMFHQNKHLAWKEFGVPMRPREFSKYFYIVSALGPAENRCPIFSLAAKQQSHIDGPAIPNWMRFSSVEILDLHKFDMKNDIFCWMAECHILPSARERGCFARTT